MLLKLLTITMLSSSAIVNGSTSGHFNNDYMAVNENTNYYIYNDSTIAYRLMTIDDNNNINTLYYNLFTKLKELGAEFDWIFTAGHFKNITIENVSNTNITFSSCQYDANSDSYYTINSYTYNYDYVNDITNSLILFREQVMYDNAISNALKDLVRLENYSFDYTSPNTTIFIQYIKFYLAPSFSLNNSFVSISEYIPNSKLYYTSLGTILDIYSISLSSYSGLILQGSETYILYEKIVSNVNIFHLNYDELTLTGGSIFITAPLTYRQYNYLVGNNILLDSGYTLNSKHTIHDLFFSNYYIPFDINESSLNTFTTDTFNLNYISNGQQFDKLSVSYAYGTLEGYTGLVLIVEINYENTYNSNSVLVADVVISQITNNGSTTPKYDYITRLEEYNTLQIAGEHITNANVANNYQRLFSKYGLGKYFTPTSEGGVGNGGSVNDDNNSEVANIFDLFTSAFESFASILALQVLPNITLGLLLIIPFIGLIIFFIIGLFKR